LHIPLDVVLIADVGLRGQHTFAGAERFGRVAESCLVDVHEHHRRAFFEEACCGFLADTARAAGDDGNFVL
jgi:hypothetical protein